MPLNPEDLIAVDRMMREQTALIAKRIPPKFGFVLIAYEDNGAGRGGWTSYSMSGSPEKAKYIMEETIEQMKNTHPIIDPIRGNMIKFPGQEKP